MTNDTDLRALLNLIAARDTAAALALLAASPTLAKAATATGATREVAEANFLSGIGQYVYGGDTALHVAAAAHRPEIARPLIAAGAAVGARNRRGQMPLHYAADGNPASADWAPGEQATVIALLIAAGADPNAQDRSGVAPLHRAVRNRCAAAVEALLVGGADGRLKNRSGSSPLDLARGATGKSGSGTPEAKAGQVEILKLLTPFG